MSSFRLCILIIKPCIRWAGVVLFELLSYYMLSAQNVGIGTPNPQATLHIAGTLRVDSVRVLPTTTNVLMLDTANQIASVSIDSLRLLMGNMSSNTIPYFFQEVSAQASTTSNAPQSRVVITLPPGGYIIFAYAEVFNTSSTAGVRMWLFEGVTEIAYGVPYSNTTTYGSWLASEFIVPSQTTTCTLSWSSWPGGTTSYIRRARLIALRVF